MTAWQIAQRIDRAPPGGSCNCVRQPEQLMSMYMAEIELGLELIWGFGIGEDDW